MSQTTQRSHFSITSCAQFPPRPRRDRVSCSEQATTVTVCSKSWHFLWNLLTVTEAHYRRGRWTREASGVSRPMVVFSRTPSPVALTPDAQLAVISHYLLSTAPAVSSARHFLYKQGGSRDLRRARSQTNTNLERARPSLICFKIKPRPNSGGGVWLEPRLFPGVLSPLLLSSNCLRCVMR